MKAKEFYELVDHLYKDCMAIMKSKGEAYSGQEDKLGNFKRIAKNLSMSPEQVWAVYFKKHIDALDAWLRGEYKDSEPIRGRIMDLINYLFLLFAIIEETESVKDYNLEDSSSQFSVDPDDFVDGEFDKYGVLIVK